MPKCIECQLFDECPVDEDDTPETFDCQDFTPKEEAATEEVTGEAEELWGEETEMTEEFEGLEEEFPEAEPEPKPKPKPKPKKPAKKPKKAEKKPAKKPTKKPPKTEPEKELKEEPKSAKLEEISLRELIADKIKEREEIMVLKVEFLLNLAKTNPKLKDELPKDFLDKLVDIVTTAEASTIANLF